MTATTGRFAAFGAEAATGAEAAIAAPHDAMQNAALNARAKRRKEGNARAMLRTESRYGIHDTSRGRSTGAKDRWSITGWPGRLVWFIACLSKPDYY
ncbi:hypothetical protein [Paraburkholderia sp. BL27I4N3]|uniref:hypothetical protein n=1 Tax=Paraburkholderia sp. BL27I4N3 TaxID=1938805 RepID=UPI0021615B5C|nr:hypothetical protein [Paraburkholderia sp. BL27I4N3]